MRNHWKPVALIGVAVTIVVASTLAFTSAETPNAPEATTLNNVVYISGDHFVSVEYIIDKHDRSKLSYGWDGDEFYGAGSTSFGASEGRYRLQIMRASDRETWIALDLLTWNTPRSRGHAGAQARTGKLDNKSKGTGKFTSVKLVPEKTEIAVAKKIPILTIIGPDGKKGTFWIRLR